MDDAVDDFRLSPRAFRLRLLLIGAVTVAAAAWMVRQPAFGQDPTYHQFADQRPLLGIPHCLNVVSNIPFLIVGVLGCRLLWLKPQQERLSYFVFFIGVGLTAFGSAYYHLEPTNDRLVWDRLPMTLAFMGLFSAIIGERVGTSAALWPLTAFGIGSVIYWHVGELHGAGDLRPYYLVQLLPMVAIPLMLLLLPAKHSRTPDLLVALGLYVAAKIVEHHDAEIHAWGELISGHTLKHLVAALAAYWILRMLRK